jgi:hypothetical protein
MRRISLALRVALLLVIVPASVGLAQTPPKPPQPPFSPAWQAVLGEWVGVGSGQPGSGEGTFAFRLELDDRIIVRKNHNDIAAAAGQPAAAHDDLMLIYPTDRVAEWRALYADNEGHVIYYRARWSADGKKLTFQSDINTGQPRYRLTYSVVSADEVVIGFEIAPPGKPDAFKSYLTGKARRNKPSGPDAPTGRK